MQDLNDVWPIVAYLAILLGLLAVMLLLSHFLGPKTKGRATHDAYESGIVAASSTRVRFTSHFFLFAIFFVIFDLEAVFLFAWAIAFHEVGLAGLIEAAIFIGVLLVGLVYLWRVGALDLIRRHTVTGGGKE